MMPVAVEDRVYRCPEDLQVVKTALRRVMVVGSCLAQAWPAVVADSNPECECDFFLFNNMAVLPDQPQGHEAADYDLQIIQLPLRSILREESYFSLSYGDIEAYKVLLAATKTRLLQMFDEAMKWNTRHGLLTFVCTFLPPQQDPMGRLLPRYDLRNFVHFVDKLNEELAAAIEDRSNAFLLNFDEVVASLGRRFFQDDAVLQLNHAAALSAVAHPLDSQRLEPAPRAIEIYPTRPFAFAKAAWREVLASYRTIHQVDAVKIVIVDLDDTLWRGVAAELEASERPDIEGWPLGVAEALTYLKRRGIILAIVSKNSEEEVIARWPFSSRLRLDDFAVAKIGWSPKPEAVAEILAQVNLLARSAVFVDDNPVEREAVRTLLPEIRTLGSNPFLTRRVLLWSPEAQISAISEESGRRTEMIRSNVERERDRGASSREEFLSSLKMNLKVGTVTTAADPDFPRTFELVNKTNQFNTTGRRWAHNEFIEFFRNGGRVLTLRVTDRFTDYGLVAALLLTGGAIKQFVMSCRVVGLDVEVAGVSEALRRMALSGSERVTAEYADTGVNKLSATVYAQCGFELNGSGWTRDTGAPLPLPSHIEVLVDPRGDSRQLMAAAPPDADAQGGPLPARSQRQ